MKAIHKPIIQIMQHYATVLDDQAVLGIVERLNIENESEAQSLLAFLDRMCERMKPDVQAGMHVLAEPIASSDAEKVVLMMHDYLEDHGYGHLFDSEDE